MSSIQMPGLAPTPRRLVFRDEAEREETLIRAARLVVRTSKMLRKPVAARTAALAAQPLDSDYQAD